MTLTFSMQIINYPFFFILIGEEKYHKRKNVYKEYIKDAQEAKGQRKS